MPNPFLNKSYLNDLILLTNDTEDIKFIEDIFLIFGNILVDIENHNEILLNVPLFITKLKEFIISGSSDNKNSNSVRNTTKLTLITLWIIEILISESNEETIHMYKYTEYIPYLMNFISTSESTNGYNSINCIELLNNTIKIIHHFSQFNSAISVLLSNDIIPSLISIINSFVYDNKSGDIDTKVAVMVLRIFNNIFSFEYSTNDIKDTNNNSIYYYYINDNYQNKLIVLFETLLHNYKTVSNSESVSLITSEILLTISNFAFRSEKETALLLNSNVSSYLLDYHIPSSNEEDSNLVLQIFENMLENGSNKSVIKILKLNFINKLCNCFRRVNKPETLLTCLNCIRNVIRFMKGISCGNSGNNVPNASNIIISEFETNGLITRLEQISLHNNEKLSQYAKSLLILFEDENCD